MWTKPNRNTTHGTNAHTDHRDGHRVLEELQAEDIGDGLHRHLAAAVGGHGRHGDDAEEAVGIVVGGVGLLAGG